MWYLRIAWRIAVVLIVLVVMYRWAHGMWMGSFLEMGATRAFADEYADGGAGIWAVGMAGIAAVMVFVGCPVREPR